MNDPDPNSVSPHAAPWLAPVAPEAPGAALAVADAERPVEAPVPDEPLPSNPQARDAQPAFDPKDDAAHGQDAKALEDALRLAEAMVFAASAPLTARALGNLLPAGMDPDAVVAALRERYAGRGVELAEVAGGLQFRTAADLAPRLRRVVVVPRRLPRAAMETLAIIAYHQPVTRAEIEEIRGASLSQQTLDTLLEQGLVAPRGRKEAPGRPTLWATTTAFLAQFGLKDLRELPRREDLLVEPPSPHQAPAEPDGAGDPAPPAADTAGV